MIVPPLGSRSFLGRDGELAVLHARRRELAQRRGSVVLIDGPAGIGKSRLLAEFCRTMSGGRAPVLVRSECLQFGALPFGPIREIVNALVANGTAELDAVAENALERGALFHSIERLIRTASRKRAIVACIEDLHWADPATLDFMAHLAAHIATDRVAIFATYRDEEIALRPEAAEAIARVTRASTTHRVSLRALDAATMTELLDCAAADRPKLARKVVREIVSRAEGNPFFAEELLKGTIDARSSEELPLSIKAIVLGRFAALSAADRKVLSHAAVLGYRFDPDLLGAIFPPKGVTVEAALRHGVRQHLIVEEPGMQLRFRFRHALTHEAIGHEMLEYETRPLHARVAERLESLPDAQGRIGEIAYHWWKANDPRAVAANEAAAEAAIALHAYADAERFYGRALGLAADPDAQSRLSTRAAFAASLQGDQELSLSYYERALNIDLAAKRFDEAGRIVRRIAGRLVYAGREADARARLQSFLLEYGALLSEVDALLVEGWPLLVELGGGGVRTWRERLMRSEAAAAAKGQPEWELLLLEVHAHADVGEVAAWHDAIERLRARSESMGPAERAWSLMMIGLTAAYMGVDEAYARAALNETHAYCEQKGLLSMRKYVAACDAFERYLHGDIRGAQAASQVALEGSSDLNQRANMAVVGPFIGLDVDDAGLIALAMDDELVALLRAGITSHSLALAAGGVAANFLALGRADEASTLLEEAVIALETTFGAQFVLPLAARHVDLPRARDAMEALLSLVAADDEAGLATRAMVEAIFAARDRATGYEALAAIAIERYANLKWPLLQAAALELTGETAAARRIYMRSGSLRHARRLTRGSQHEDRAADESGARVMLTAREREIAASVAAGFGNTQIATRLGLSVKTVESHLSRIYARLGFRSRAQLAAYIANERAPSA
jgi:DNA-binding CsgD family transcriptional regulator